MITYRLATVEDNGQLVELTASDGMSGEIGLRIERNPDFFRLLELRGDSKVFVALDNDTIIGAICISLQQIYINGTTLPLYYIGDFKVTSNYRRHGIGLKLCDHAAEYILNQNVDLVFLNVSKGNTDPISFFKNRPNVPNFTNIGLFNIYQFIGISKPPRHNNYQIEHSAVDEEIIDYLNLKYQKNPLSSVINKDKLHGAECFVIKENDQIIAAMSLVDMMSIKQNIVTSLSWKIKLILKLFNSISKILGISKMPVLHEPVKLLYIKYLAINNNNKILVKLLVDYARNMAYQRSYSFASIGLHSRDPLNNSFSGMLKLTFKSVGMLLSINNNFQLINSVTQGVPFEDYSLV